MKILLQLTCAALIGTLSTSLGQDKASVPAKSGSREAEIVELERITFEAYKNKQADTFKKYLAPNYRGIYEDGIQDAEVETSGMATIDLRNYSFSDATVIFQSADVAVISFKAAMDLSSKGKDISGTYNCGSVWIKKGGKWLTIIHTELKTP